MAFPFDYVLPEYIVSECMSTTLIAKFFTWFDVLSTT